jgi:choline dehydrogenase-like flavoprotein
VRRFDLKDDSVAVVIGSGAGGGTLSNELAQRGIDVVCLEAGPRLAPADVVNDEAKMFERLTWFDRRVGTGIAQSEFPVWTCKTVGGTTMHWTASCPRLQEHEMRARSTYGDVPDANLVDWPFNLEDLEPYYARAENKLGVTGTNGIERLPGNNNYKVLETGAREVGYADIDTNNVAINSAPRDGRPACLQLGFCISGCVIQAKWSTLYTEISRAETTEHFELREESMAVRVNHNANGRVTGVEYLDKSGHRLEQKAKLVCVAGNAVETTRILLNSASEQFPAGLANSSDQVGRNYMRHLVIPVIGIMPGEVNMHRGTHQAGIVKDERHNDPDRGFVGGYIFLTVPFAPEAVGKIILQDMWGKQLASIMENYKYMAAMLIHGEDMPQESNRISLHPSEKDQFGLPVPVVHYEDHPNNALLKTAATVKGHAIYEALGAKQIFSADDVFPSTHNMGVARMGTNPNRSVCNPWGRTHEIENLFVSDGSLFPTVGCENPTLTIIALVLRQADYIERQIQRGSL